MDHLAEHEAFLRAIFDAPDDDTPRLVYADFLEEHGDPDRAAYIRLACEVARCPADDPRRQALQEAGSLLVRKRPPTDAWPWANEPTVRGFPLPTGPVRLTAADLDDITGLRASAVRAVPESFGARSLKVTPGMPLGPEHVEKLFALPFTQQVTEWDLGGYVEELTDPAEPGDAGTYALIDLHHQPVVTGAAVEALAGHRGARRITSLTLTDNDLDNDAARALVKSPYLVCLTRLDLLRGNRLHGRTWQLLLERYGEGVVG